jgi:glycosyltransferase involved in cell wall biosynthesis
MRASDAICLPSYREGFGSVLIEAAAVGVPAIASRIYGVVDAVVDEETGLLHEPGDVDGLLGRLRRITRDPVLRRTLGDAGRARVAREFSQDRLTAALLEVFADLVGGHSASDGSGSPHRRGQPSLVAGGGGYGR